MLTWLGGLLFKRRWSVVVAAVLLALVMGLYGFQVFDSLQGVGLEDPQSESIRARDLINTTFSAQNSNASTMIVLLSDPHLLATDPQFVQAAQQIIDRLKGRSEVLSLSSYYSTHSSSFLSRDHHQTFIYANISTKNGETKAYNALNSLLSAPPLTVSVGGTIATDVQFNQQLQHDLEFSETIALPIVALMLVIIFNGLVAASLPLLVGGFAIVGSFALLRVLTLFTGVSSFATNVITIIGLGLAIDYSLFIITRFREELVADEKDVEGALRRTMMTAGRTVLFSGLTVCTSLLSLLIFPQAVLRSVGLATIAAALVAMLGSLTVLPALLSLLGPRVNALSLRRIFHRKKQGSADIDPQRGAWYRLSYFVMRWSIPITLAVVVFLLALGSPFLHVSFSSADERSLPLTASSRIVVEQLQQNFPGQDDSQITIAIRTHGDALNANNLVALNSYVDRLQQLSHVSQVQSAVSFAPGVTLAQYQQMYAHPTVNPQVSTAVKQFAKGDVTQVLVTATLDPHSTEVQSLVRTIRGLSVPGNMTVLVGGQAAQSVDLLASLAASIPYAALIMVCAIFVLLFLMTGSLIMPIKAVVLNILSLTATFGALVWIFQDGHFQNLLQFKAFGSIDSTQIILIFAIAFGLSMDYEVFLMSRIKEQFDRTGDNRESVAIGLQRTGWLITSAALLLSIVVAAFASSRVLEVQEIGVGLALAVLMDATLVRALLVPAMMNLLGTLNWWAPAPLRFVHRRIGLHEAVEPVPAVPTSAAFPFESSVAFEEDAASDVSIVESDEDGEMVPR